MNVYWTDSAIEHLGAVYRYVAETSSEYALRVVDRLTKRSQQIALFPLSGRVLPEMNVPQIREVVEGPYRIIYHIKPDRIEVLAVIHGAQFFPWQDAP